MRDEEVGCVPLIRALNHAYLALTFCCLLRNIVRWIGTVTLYPPITYTRKKTYS